MHIYILSDPRTGQVRYVGKANKPQKRLRHHLEEKGQRTRKYFWIRSLKNRGLRPIMTVIESFPLESGDTLWPEAERKWIAHYRALIPNLCNHDSGGNHGFKKSDVTRRKISLANTGKKRSDEVKIKISIAKSNPSDETRARIRACKTGLRASEETKQKMRASHHGISPEVRVKMRLSRIKGTLSRKLLNPPPPKPPRKKLPPISEETRLRLRLSHLGYKHSDETKQKMVAIRKGRPRTPEDIQKMKDGWVRRRANKLLDATAVLA